MNRHALLSLLALLLCCSTSLPAQKAKTYIPWKNGKLVVSEEGRYLKHENGVPFFWLGETGWLMPQRLNRDEVSYYLNKCKDAGYNMVQVCSYYAAVHRKVLNRRKLLRIVFP